MDRAGHHPGPRRSGAFHRLESLEVPCQQGQPGFKQVDAQGQLAVGQRQRLESREQEEEEGAEAPSSAGG